LDEIVPDELDEISGTFSANFLSTIKEHTASLYGFKYDDSKTITNED
jgi:hypothetical protein